MQKIDLTGLYLTEDITISDHEYDNPERYGYTENIDDCLRFIVDDEKAKADKDERAEAAALLSQFEANAPESVDAIRDWLNEHDTAYDSWRDTVSFEEQYNTPMMNALRYFPDFVSFTDADRYNVASNTCLVYDTERDAWAVGMSGGGMNLAPHLLDTFIQLRHCIPLELAWGIEDSYSAFVNHERHTENCKILSASFDDYAKRCTIKAGQLMGEVSETLKD